jgi:hypothetical protein
MKKKTIQLAIKSNIDNKNEENLIFSSLHDLIKKLYKKRAGRIHLKGLGC